jgi:hypothetical protein
MQSAFSANRDRLNPRLAELSRKLRADPSPRNIMLVADELERLSRG